MKSNKKKYSIGGTIGTIAGTALGGPVGAAIGSTVGTLGEKLLFGSPEQKAAEQEAKKIKELQEEQALNSVKARSLQLNEPYGEGKMMYNLGGEVTPLSNDSVEVTASDPSKTDSVDMGNFMVDDNEVIKKGVDGLSIYSDDLLIPGTDKSFAEAAKELEKQKTLNNKTNEGIDSEMKNLFDRQQSINGNNSDSKSFKYGGKKKYAMGGDPYNIQLKPLADMPNAGTGIPTNKSWTTKSGLERTSPYSDLLVGADRNLNTDHNPNPSVLTKLTNGIDIPEMGNVGNVGNALIQASAFIPNINNAFTKLPEVPQPRLQSNVDLKDISLEADRTAINEQAAASRQSLRDVAIQPGQASANIAALNASNLDRMSRVNQQEANMNQQIGNREAVINSSIEARNNALVNRTQEEAASREIADKRLRSENMASIANKIMTMGAEKQRKNLDEQKLQLIAAKFQNTGVLERALQRLEGQGLSSGEILNELLKLD